MAGVCGKRVEAEAEEFVRAVVTEVLNVVLRSGVSSMYMQTVQPPRATHSKGLQIWFHVLLSPSWNLKFLNKRPCISFTTGPYKLWPYPCWSVETICISRKKNFFKQSNLSLVLKRCQSAYTNANNSQKKEEKFLKIMLLTKLLTKEISSVTVILALFCWFLLTLYKILNIPWDNLYKMNTLYSTGKIIWHSLCKNIQCFILSLKLDLLST